jgi:hypothetical protein
MHQMETILEHWTLQTIFMSIILMHCLAFALLVSEAHLGGIRERLSLRVARETWDTAIDLGVDLLLALALVTALIVMTPDSMLEARVALPWQPIGIVLAAACLLCRALPGGKRHGAAGWWVALCALALACALEIGGLHIVAAGPGDVWSAGHPHALWARAGRMRSEGNPSLVIPTYLVTAPLLGLMALGSALAAAGALVRAQRERPATDDGWEVMASVRNGNAARRHDDPGD